MPLYEYECDACGRRFELIRKFSESELDVCTLCGKGPVRRLLSSPAIQFKGTGWYITDYSSKGKASESSAPKGDTTKSDTGAKEKESAPAAKSESPSPSKTSSDA